MVDYIKFKLRENLKRLNERDIQALREQIDVVDVENKRRFEAALAKHVELVRLAADVYGKRSRQTAYIAREKPAGPPLLKAERRKLERRWQSELERRQRLEYERERRQRSKHLTEILEDIGYQQEVHFRKSNAISFAKRNLMKTEEGRLVPMLPFPQVADTEQQADRELVEGGDG